MHPRLKALADRPLHVALLIGIGAWLLFVFRLGAPIKPFFDETHYVPAARALLALDIPRNTEHPLVGKELIAAGIALFGDNIWGWRLIATLFGASTVVAVFSLLWLMLRNMRLAVIGALLVVLNQHVFIQARIAMLDVFLGAFILWAMVVFLWAAKGTPKQVRWRWVLGSALLGLAVAVKWAAIPYVAMAGIAFIVLRLSERPGSRDHGLLRLGTWLLAGLSLLFVAWSMLAGLVDAVPENPLWHPEVPGGSLIRLMILATIVAAAYPCWRRLAAAKAAFANPSVKALPGEGHIRWPGLGIIPGLALMAGVSIPLYLLTFLPAFFYAQNPLTLATLIPFQFDMYAQQTQVLAAHTYQSEWYQWPLISRPIWYFYEPDPIQHAGVLLVGNPLIMWGGVLAAILCLISWFETKAIRPGFAAALWIASIAIYIVIPKSLGFYYYYYLSSIFLCIALPIGFDLLDGQRRMALGEWFTAVSLLLFLYFYPIIAAIPLSDPSKFQNWMWFSSWL